MRIFIGIVFRMELRKRTGILRSDLLKRPVAWMARAYASYRNRDGNRIYRDEKPQSLGADIHPYCVIMKLRQKTVKLQSKLLAGNRKLGHNDQSKVLSEASWTIMFARE